MSAKVIQFPRRYVVGAAPYPSVSDGLSVFSPDNGKTWRIAKNGRELALSRDEMQTIHDGWEVVGRNGRSP